MIYNREAKEVLTKSRGKGRVWRLAEVPPSVFWNWIKTDFVHKGMFEDYIAAQKDSSLS